MALAGAADSLAGRRVLVTGADRGIGQGIAVAMAAAGAAVAVHHPPTGPGPDETASMITDAGSRPVLVAGDLAEPSVCRAVVDEAVRLLGGLDVLVNNAGVTASVPFTEVPDALFAELVAINLGGQFFCAQRAVSYLREGTEPSIVNVGSIHGSRGYRHSTLYAATKGAIESWTRALAIELGPVIRVNVIAPGLVETPRIREAPDYAPERVAAHNPLHRVALPDDIADVAVFLASNASRYITGQVVHVDGGATAH